MFGIRTAIFLILCFMGALAIEKLCGWELAPRNKGDQVYRQWCCPRCEHWTSAYGPPYTCSNCGKTVPL